MDINSRNVQDNKLLRNINKLKLARKLINIILLILIIGIMIFIENKKEGIIISLFLVMVLLIIKNLSNDFRDVLIFQEIFEISNTCEDIIDIFEKTNGNIEKSVLFGKSHKSILDNLYKVEKYIYSAIVKSKQNENMSNELVVEVSKNIKKPVNNIIKSVNELENNNSKVNYLEIIDNLENQSNTLKHNIEELFELSKVMTGNIEIEMQKIDVISLLKQSLVEYKDKMQDKSLNLKVNIDNSNMYIYADGQQMWRVFEILLDNIIYYSKEKTRVYVNLSKNDEEVNISLINISKEELNIDISTLLKSIRENNESNKMGLAIASNLISIQNGNLDITIDGDMFKVDIKFKLIDNIK
ncbi:sensor histidine kinase [Romboutsia ilealis]|uniref:histidine kinase n=1 Tax=Romboutsia faecis TaxID=2764597 RepID=A0ABR7JMR4_9FIRM|nr:sensor histidine kinase [Romboutsia faecis]MBC5996208.1 sensor histidine kinase [Romboutsia faecis]MRN25148.1 sensor histidine kinase [Romboutsia ilealis]